MFILDNGYKIYIFPYFFFKICLQQIIIRILNVLVYTVTHIVIEYLLGSLVVDSRENAYSGEEGTAERTTEKRS